MGRRQHLPPQLSTLPLLSPPVLDLRDPLWEAARNTTEAVLCCSPGAVTTVRIKKDKYALNNLSQIPGNPFFSHGNESDERGTCAALTLLLGSFKPVSGHPDGNFAHLHRDTGTPPPLRSHSRSC